MSAATNAQILHALSQLIKLNGQMLKLRNYSPPSQIIYQLLAILDGICRRGRGANEAYGRVRRNER